MWPFDIRRKKREAEAREQAARDARRNDPVRDKAWADTRNSLRASSSSRPASASASSSSSAPVDNSWQPVSSWDSPEPARCAPASSHSHHSSPSCSSSSSHSSHDSGSSYSSDSGSSGDCGGGGGGGGGGCD
jgi:hypothetical protein